MTRRVWPWLDTIAHQLHVGGRLGRYLCYRADRAFGLSEHEARS